MIYKRIGRGEEAILFNLTIIVKFSYRDPDVGRINLTEMHCTIFSMETHVHSFNLILSELAMVSLKCLMVKL